MLEVTGLHKRYGGLVAVEEVSFVARAGEMVGLLGPNGAGKTTTVSMIAGLLAPDRGEVQIEGGGARGNRPGEIAPGAGAAGSGAARRAFGARELALFGAIYGMRGAALARHGIGIRSSGIGGPRQRSRGYLQRGHEAAIEPGGGVAAWSAGLLLDEPTVGVDPQSHNQIFASLQELKRQGKTLVYTTHYMEEAERLCDRIIIIDHGKVIANDSLEAVRRLVPSVKVIEIGVENAGQVGWLDGLRAVEDVSAAEWDGWTTRCVTPLRRMLQGVGEWNQRKNASPRAQANSGFSMPYRVSQEAVTTRQGVKYNSMAHSFAGMWVQFILFMGIDAGMVVLYQRRSGLWKRLKAAPLSRYVMIGSRAASAAIVAMVIMLTVFGFARMVFGVRIEGRFAGFLAVCVAFAIMTATFGLLVAVIGKTPEATRGIAILVTLILVMLGGSWVPAFIFPQWLQTVSFAVPTRWAVDGLDAMVWRGSGFEAALGPVGALLGFAAVFGAFAVWRFRWESEG